MNLAQILIEKTHDASQKTALQFKDQQRTYGDLNQQIKKAARVLMDLTIIKGDRVALLLPKSLEFIEFYLATLSLGAIVLPLNPAYRLDELEYFLSDSEASLLVTTPEKGSELTPFLKVSLGLRILILNTDAPWNSPYSQGKENPAAPVELPFPTREEDIALLCYTSGTTGRSKGAMITHGNLIHNMEALHEAWHWSDQDRLLHVLPLFHIHGLAVALHGGLFAGGTIILEEKFDPIRTWQLLENEYCTLLMAVPTIYQRLSQAWETLEKKPDLDTMRVFISGSAPLPEPLFHQFQRQTGHTLLERYGMTETGMITSNPYDPELRQPGSVGYPLKGVGIRIVGKDNRDVPKGEVGEIWIKGNNVFKGYWKQPEKTIESFEGGWFKSGDLGFQDPEDRQRLFLKGRSKELIISGGFNVYPKEIETILEAHDYVQEAAVFGLAHEDLGEQVVAAVVLKGTGLITGEELIAYCKGRLAGYKCPQKIVLRPTLPRNALGKLQKHRLPHEVG